jgi:hypothetical protein
MVLVDNFLYVISRGYRKFALLSHMLYALVYDENLCKSPSIGKVRQQACQFLTKRHNKVTE